MHDVEYVATPVKNGSTAGDHLRALEEPNNWGLKVGDEAKIWGDGDQQVLDAIGELWKMKEEGLIKAVGISGAGSCHLLYKSCANLSERLSSPGASPACATGSAQPSIQVTGYPPLVFALHPAK